LARVFSRLGARPYSSMPLRRPALGVGVRANANRDVVEPGRTRLRQGTRKGFRKKNDQAWVEQKNGSVVRRMVGYGRLEGLVAAEALSRLYRATRLFVNFFQPSFKLAEKTRVGAKVKKAQEPACGRQNLRCIR
jgi:hypothetical protein